MSSVLTRNTLTKGETYTLHERKTDVRTTDGSDDTDYSGWYCIATDPFECPGCGVIVRHLTSLHKIITWPEKDDPEILDMAARLKAFGRNPQIVSYEVDLGPCISWYQLEALRAPGGNYPHHGR